MMEKTARTQSFQPSRADASVLSRRSRRLRPDAQVRLTIGELPEDVVQRASDLPAWIVGPQATQVADVGDVIAETTRFHVFHGESLASEVLAARDRLEDRDAVRATAAKIVHGGRSRRLVELEKRRADVVRVEVVTNLLALVAVHAVDAAFLDGPGEVSEEAMKLRRGVVGPGQASATEAHRGHAKVSPVLLDHDVGGQLGCAKDAVE